VRDTQTRPARRVERALQAVGRLAQAILDSEDSETLLHEVAQAAQELVGAKVTMVVTIDGDRQLATVSALTGVTAGPIAVGDTAPLAGTAIADVVRTGSTALWRGPQDASEAGRRIMLGYQIGPVAAVPLASDGEIRGVLLVGKAADAAPFRQLEIDLIATFAHQASCAIHMRDLRASEADLTLRSERERIARDLHDGVVQTLYGLGMSLRATVDRTAAVVDAAIIEDALAGLDDAIEAVRDYIGDLEPAAAPAQSNAVRTGDAPPSAESSQRNSPRDAIAALGSLAEATLAGRTLRSVLAQLVGGVIERSQADFCVLGTLTDDGRSLEIRAVAGRDIIGRRVGDDVPLSQTLAAEAIRSGRPVVTATPEQASLAMKRTLGRLGMGPVVAVPMTVRGRAFGGLAVGRNVGSPPFSRGDVHMIEAHSVQASVALEFDRVRQELKRGVVSQERRRVGTELHERVIQDLFGVGLALQSVAGNVRDDTFRVTLRSAVDSIDRVIKDLRRYVFDLGPSLPVDHRLDIELRNLASDLVGDAPVDLTVDVDPAVFAIVTPWAGDLLQIVREAVSNVVQHAHAKQCIVRLFPKDGDVVLEVLDDGGGLPNRQTPAGHGLQNIRTRAAALGGRVEIGANRPRGTLVMLTVPIGSETLRATK